MLCWQKEKPRLLSHPLRWIRRRLHLVARFVEVGKAVGIKIATIVIATIVGEGLEIGLPARIAPLTLPVTAIAAAAAGVAGVDAAEGCPIRSTPHAPQAREKHRKPHPLLRMSGNC